MAEDLSSADRFTLQTALSNAGLSWTGAMQLANEQIVTDSADRELLAQLICRLLVENPTTVGSATQGAGAGKIKFNEFTIRKQ